MKLFGIKLNIENVLILILGLLLIASPVLAISLLIKGEKEGFENDKKPDDLFTDGLDNKEGLKKINRHHSF